MTKTTRIVCLCILGVVGTLCGVSIINAPTKVLLLPINLMVNTYVGGVMAGMVKKITLYDGGLLYLYYLYNLI